MPVRFVYSGFYLKSSADKQTYFPSLHFVVDNYVLDRAQSKTNPETKKTGNRHHIYIFVHMTKEHKRNKRPA